MENLIQRWTQSRPFFLKTGHFFQFSKSAGEASLLSTSCAPVSVAEYASISLNISELSFENPWINYSDYARALNMHDRLLKMPRVLNKPGFCIWHGCISKGYAEFGICLIMAPYTSVMPEYTWIYLIIPQQSWK